MKIKSFASIVLLLAVAACNQNKEKKAPTEYPVNDPLLGNVTTDTSHVELGENEQCFMAHVKKDSAFISIKKIGPKVAGKLWYKFYEKDNAKGTFTGTMNQDTLNLDYTFSAEGSTSERPIKMLFENGGLYEINGNEVTKESQGFVYVKSECRNF